ncbi:MAG: ATP-binding protein, partial [Ktedonobacterales bacterium]|nr:ATP-binding protein [Ktedonobacterales bacterium]
RVLALEAPATPVPVVVDADRIGQVVTNYLTNALKYSDADRPVSVSLERVGPLARVRVRDEGPGLSAEQCARLWERGYRAPGIEVRSGTGVGLGLGLYISRAIIERHGGQVGVESAPGHGSTFWLTLPLTARASA